MLWIGNHLAESFYYVNYGLSSITSNGSQIISFLWKHQCFCFHYWDYLTNFWRNNWRSIIDVVERLGFWLTSILWRLSTAKQQQPTLWIWRSLAVLCSITKECLSSYGTLLHAFSPTTHHYTPGTPTQLRLACSPFYEKGIFDF